MPNADWSAVADALSAIRQGRMIVLVDDEERENEGDLVIAAEHVTDVDINFMCQYGRGLVCCPLTAEDFDRLQIPLMTPHNRSKHHTAFGVSFEAAGQHSTGISAADRAAAAKIAVDPNSTPRDIVMPGHMFPLKAHPGGVLARAGHTEGAVDLTRLAGLKPGAVICEIMSSDGSMARRSELLAFAKHHGLPIITIQSIIEYRYQHETLITLAASTKLPLKNRGDFTLQVFKSNHDDADIIAVMKLPTVAKETPCLLRIHSECLSGDVFGSDRCDCGWQLETALAEINRQGGILIYLRQEGRGIGLVNKIKAYTLQDQGMDTVEANHHLGFGADLRDYGVAAQVLRVLNIKQVRLLTNNPHKMVRLGDFGVHVVERVPLEMQPTENNIDYLRSKREKLGHLLTFKS